MAIAMNNNVAPHKSKSTMVTNDDHRQQCRNRPNDAVERFHLHTNNTPDSQPGSSDKETPYDEDYLYDMSSAQTSPVANSEWSYREQSVPGSTDVYSNYTGLLASLVREEGHIYSMAANDDMLFTGSDGKNIRVWKNRKVFSGFKSRSALVKAIVITDDKIFTGHSDGKIRVWIASVKNPSVYKKIETLPNFKSIVKKSIKPKNYTEMRNNRRAIWIKHFDVISSLNLSEDHTLLYSASWDKTIKVWNVSNFKCLESISAHDDAVNVVVAGFDGYVFSGSADGAIKVWRREKPGKRTKHSLVETLLSQESAVTSLVVNPSSTVVYAGLSDGFLHFWERDRLFSGSSVFRCHKLAVLCLAVAGSLVFTGSADASIRVWRRDDNGEHKCMYTLSGHRGPVKCLAVDMRCECDEGSWLLYSGSLDRSVNIWRVCTEERQPSKPKDRPQRSNNVGFQTFSDQGRLNQRKK